MRKAKIRNRYNQVPYLTQKPIGEVTKTQENTRKHNTQESQGVSSFLAGDHKASRNIQRQHNKDKNETYIMKISTIEASPWNGQQNKKKMVYW